MQKAELVFMELSRLPQDVWIHSLLDFRGHTLADQEEHFAAVQTFLQLYQEMAPLLEQGAPPETWEAWDKERGRGPEQNDPRRRIGYARTYELFFGLGERMQVIPQADGSFQVEQGRHRLWMARRLGIPRLPVFILREEDDPNHQPGPTTL